MTLTALDLARIQFAFTVSFHIVFPALSIGLASFIAVLEGLWLKTGRQVYLDLCRFWSKVFAVGFAMGVVSGLVMSYQFGTNWSAFSNFAGSITGPLLTYEVLTAFFLEAGFLGIMLFGWNRVGRRAHFAATVMVAVGTLVSTFWILASNSWMQTPAGFTIADGRVVPVDWWAVIFNPSFPYRLAHMTLSAFIATSLLVAGCAAWHLLRGTRAEGVRISLSMALGILLVLAPLQVFVGDLHGLNTLRHQPAKLAAMEGLWESGPDGVPFTVFGIPDMEAETTRYALEIPRLGSVILTHSWNGQVRGLKAFPKADRPDALIVFWSFRVMVGLGLLMLAMAGASWVLRRRGALFETRWFLRFAVLMSPAGFIAMLAGWFTTEVGRQPWVVYGVMRTADAVSPVTRQAVGVSLMIFVVVYFLVFGTGMYYLLRLLRKGPGTHEPTPSGQKEPFGPWVTWSGRRPLSGAGGGVEDDSEGGEGHV
ncbi:cytochrome ubiquinol oxidase subunit I [Paludibacterium paludis]|uniref:Cytochrome ubiquinol oxidase subunit I n=1 Tax=Paludibacterium paludis TaxID=1225769 RepID=A0A918U9X9_9NEIS|nr:cytochrome ubiquinol oxidase subunit I [Paludibacterium paludis]GGY14015.1 cytochrome ubiquinol oxidase subunit I [Paludibacterium paludis]